MSKDHWGAAVYFTFLVSSQLTWNLDGFQLQVDHAAWPLHPGVLWKKVNLIVKSQIEEKQCGFCPGCEERLKIRIVSAFRKICVSAGFIRLH